MSKPADTETRAVPRPCPICGKPASVEHRPFCSRRCADIDLYRWLKGGYAIPAAPEAEEEETPPEGEDRGSENRR